MSKTSELLFEYLKNIIYAPNKASLNPQELDEDYVKLGQGLMFFAQCLNEANDFAKNIAKGNLQVEPPPPQNMLAGVLKSLHSRLKHLTWQSKQVAKGDYSQRVDFLGQFADAFNIMVEQLAERQQKLECEIEASQESAKALELTNQLLSNITHRIPQQIFVLDENTHEVLLINSLAEAEIQQDKNYLETLLSLMSEDGRAGKEQQSLEVQLSLENRERFLSVERYLLTWNGKKAEALIINDTSKEKARLKVLEGHAYRDALTGVYNRFYGMTVLSEWVDIKTTFALVFFDLDNLKYINDTFGHMEGDRFIINAANCLDMLPKGSVASRIGGDEFMLLIPQADYDAANEIVQALLKAMKEDEYLANKHYTYEASYGIVAVDEDCSLSYSEILSLADERMYENKRARKKNRNEGLIN